MEDALESGASMSETLDLNFSNFHRFASSFFGSLESGIVKKHRVWLIVRNARSNVISMVFGLGVCMVLWNVVSLVFFILIIINFRIERYLC